MAFRNVASRLYRKADIYWLLLLVLVVASLSRTMGLYFLADDFGELELVYNHERLRPGVEMLSRYFCPSEHTTNWHFFRPTWKFLYWWDSAWWGTHAVGFRISTLLLQIGAVSGLYALALKLQLSRVFAFTWAACFALHPLSVESFTWFAARSDLLVMAFGSWGTWLLLEDRPAILPHGGRAPHALQIRKLMGILFVFLAATRKEHGILFLGLPFALLLARRYTQEGFMQTARSLRSWRDIGTVLVMIAIFFLQRWWVIGRPIGGYASTEISLLSSGPKAWALLQNIAWPGPGGSAIAVLSALLAGITLTILLRRHAHIWNLQVVTLLFASSIVGYVATSPFIFQVGAFSDMRIGYALLMPATLLIAIANWGFASLLVKIIPGRLSTGAVSLLLISPILGVYAYQQQIFLNDYVAASNITRNLIKGAQILDREPYRDKTIIIYDIPTKAGVAYAALNITWHGNRPPFFSPARPFLRMRPRSVLGWTYLAKDLRLLKSAHRPYRWSWDEGRVVPSARLRHFSKQGTLLVLAKESLGTVYGLDSPDNKMYCAETPDTSLVGQEVSIEGYVVQSNEGPLLLVTHLRAAASDQSTQRKMGFESNHAADAINASSIKMVIKATKLSWSKGGVQEFDIDAGKENAGRIYILLGSLRGEGRLPLPNDVDLHLDPDDYFAFLLAQPNTFIEGSLGSLDDQGHAKARLTLPPQSAQLHVGMRFTHACVLLDQDMTKVLSASNPTTFTLTR